MHCINNVLRWIHRAIVATTVAETVASADEATVWMMQLYWKFVLQNEVPLTDALTVDFNRFFYNRCVGLQQQSYTVTSPPPEYMISLEIYWKGNWQNLGGTDRNNLTVKQNGYHFSGSRCCCKVTINSSENRDDRRGHVQTDRTTLYILQILEREWNAPLALNDPNLHNDARTAAVVAEKIAKCIYSPH